MMNPTYKRGVSAPLHNAIMHRSKRKRRRRVVVASLYHVLVAAAFLSHLRSSPRCRRLMVVQALSISSPPPLRILRSTTMTGAAALRSSVHRRYLSIDSKKSRSDGNTQLLSSFINIDISTMALHATTPSRLDDNPAPTNTQSYNSEHDTTTSERRSTSPSSLNGSSGSSRVATNTNNEAANSNKQQQKQQNQDKQQSSSPSSPPANNAPMDSWLDRTTARLLSSPPTSNNGNNNNPQNNQQNQHIPTGQLTPDDVSLITTLMTSHARRSTIESALICERLLKRVVEEVNAGNTSVRVTTKMYTVAMDAWAKSQRRPLPGKGGAGGFGGFGGGNNNGGGKDGKNNQKKKGGNNGGLYGFEGESSNNNNSNNNSNHHKQNQRNNNQHSSRQPQRQNNQQLQLHPSQLHQQSSNGNSNGSSSSPNQQKQRNQPKMPLGAAAQRAHRIHNSLVQTFQQTRDVHLAPSTISYNAAINAWSKSYHPSAGEMAELLLGEMMGEWRLGESVVIEESMDDELEESGGDDELLQREDEENYGNEVNEDDDDDDDDDEATSSVASAASAVTPKQAKVGNERVKPDVVTFTAVIDAWVKCTALAHDYHYESQPPNSDSSTSSSSSSSSSTGGNNTSSTTAAAAGTTPTTNNPSYIEWKRSQAAKADELTQRAANRAKQLLELMITLGHYDPERHGGDNGDEDGNVTTNVDDEIRRGNGGDDGDGSSSSDDNGTTALLPLTKCEPGMRPNCYTYSAVMNALAKSCSALRVHGTGADGSSNNSNNNNNRGGGRNANNNRNTRGRRSVGTRNPVSRPAQHAYDPAREAQDMLENMIIKHARYKERVGESGMWRVNGGARYDTGTSRSDHGTNDGWVLMQEDEDNEDDNDDDEDDGMNGVNSKYEEWMKGSWSTAKSFSSNDTLPLVSDNDINDNENNNDDDDDDDDNHPEHNDPHWFEPRPNELTFPPNTINYNSVLNAWSRASRYDPHAALRAEKILLNRMELPYEGSGGKGNKGGDNVEPDALSYSLVIHAWLRGCRGNNNSGNGGAGGAGARSGGAGDSNSAAAAGASRARQSSSHPRQNNGNNSNRRFEGEGRGGGPRGRMVTYTDQDRIERAMNIADRLEAWARRTRSTSHSTHNNQWSSGKKSNQAMDKSSNNSTTVMVTTNDEEDDDDAQEMDTFNDSNIVSNRNHRSSNTYTFRQHNKARDLDVEVYNSILVAYSREQTGDHAASVMQLLDRMELLAEELDMPSVRPNQRSYNVALGVIANAATRVDTSLAEYYKGDDGDDVSDYSDDEIEEEEDEEEEEEEEKTPKSSGSRRKRKEDKINKTKLDNKNNKSSTKKKPKKQPQQPFNPLYAGRAAESILGRMLSRNFRPDAYTFASVLNTYQRIPKGKLDAALAADGVVRGMESLHLHGRIDEPPDVFHYTMVCACWSRSGEQGVAGERCSEILRHMQERDTAGYPRVRPNIRTFNAVIDSHAYNGRVAEAEDMLLSMVDNYESSAARSMDGIEDEELPIRPDSFSFNTVIQQWARSRTPEGGRRAEVVLDRMLKFHYDGNADVRPDERSFAYIIYHYTKGAGRMNPDAPDRALKLLRRMIQMYRQGYKELLPAYQNKTNPIFAFTSVVDAHSVLRRSDSGIVGDELLGAMAKLGKTIEALRPNTYACLSVLYGWSSCGAVDAGEQATKLLQKMEADMKAAEKRGEESIMRTTQRCYILAQTSWARSPSKNKAAGALEVLDMMERNFASGNLESKPTVQAYSMVLNACAFADMVQDNNGRAVKASMKTQQKAFHIAELTLDRIRKEPYHNVAPNPVIYGTFIKCCGRLDLPEDIAVESAKRVFEECRQAGLVSDFVLTQLRYALRPAQFLEVLVKNGYADLDRKGKSISRDGKRIRHIRVSELPQDWTMNVDRNK